MKIHIGELIKRKLEECGMDKTVFAHRIKKSYPTALNIFKKSSIKTEDLLRISKVLKYDFFRVYSAELQLTCPEATSNVRPASATRRKSGSDLGTPSASEAKISVSMADRSPSGKRGGHIGQHENPAFSQTTTGTIPRFKKTVYSADFIETLVQQINDGTLSRNEAIKKYELPKTTLYRWCRKDAMMN